ncbi:MAG: hypothetical protein JWR85_1520, partial [Marmoricola sp.]|nr:hypothetical protein [Marmoricola sp.]
RLRPLLVTETTLSTVLSLALGAGYCVVTDGVTGANIGGGLVLLLAGPLTLAALALGVVLAVIDRRQSAHRAA